VLRSMTPSSWSSSTVPGPCGSMEGVGVPKLEDAAHWPAPGSLELVPQPRGTRPTPPAWSTAPGGVQPVVQDAADGVVRLHRPRQARIAPLQLLQLAEQRHWTAGWGAVVPRGFTADRRKIHSITTTHTNKGHTYISVDGGETTNRPCIVTHISPSRKGIYFHVGIEIESPIATGPPASPRLNPYLLSHQSDAYRWGGGGSTFHFSRPATLQCRVASLGTGPLPISTVDSCSDGQKMIKMAEMSELSERIGAGLAALYRLFHTDNDTWQGANPVDRRGKVRESSVGAPIQKRGKKIGARGAMKGSFTPWVLPPPPGRVKGVCPAAFQEWPVTTPLPQPGGGE